MTNARKKPLPKLALPDAQRCDMDDSKGRRCPRQREYICRRQDGKESRYCRTCAYKLRDQIQSHPGYFGNVRFIAINKYQPVQ